MLRGITRVRHAITKQASLGNDNNEVNEMDYILPASAAGQKPYTYST